jgi:hypothetical protein
MDIPTFLKGEFEECWDYFEQQQQTLLDGLGDNGFDITNITMAQLAMITNMNFLPVLNAGRMFFVTDLLPEPSWQGIQVAAVPGVSNAVIKTFIVT